MKYLANAIEDERLAPADKEVSARRGFTLIELLVVVSIIGLLVSILAPAVQACREAARRTDCAANMRQLALGANAFHAVQGSFPPPRMNSADTWGQFARMLPYLDQAVVFKTLDPTKPIDDPANIAVTELPMRVMRCAADTDRLTASTNSQALFGWSRCNYRGNGGNDTGQISSQGTENNNGVFVTGHRVAIDQITDGTGNTALFSEALIGDGNNQVVSHPGDWFVLSTAGTDRAALYAALQSVATPLGAGQQLSLAGRTYTSGNYLDTRYNHIAAPNGPSGVVALDGSDLISAVNNGPQATTASSRHPGGVNLVLVDGSVRFVKNSVNIQVWWALGSINGGEGIFEDY